MPCEQWLMVQKTWVDVFAKNPCGHESIWPEIVKLLSIFWVWIARVKMNSLSFSDPKVTRFGKGCSYSPRSVFQIPLYSGVTMSQHYANIHPKFESALCCCFQVNVKNATPVPGFWELHFLPTVATRRSVRFQREQLHIIYPWYDWGPTHFRQQCSKNIRKTSKYLALAVGARCSSYDQTNCFIGMNLLFLALMSQRVRSADMMSRELYGAEVCYDLTAFPGGNKRPAGTVRLCILG